MGSEKPADVGFDRGLAVASAVFAVIAVAWMTFLTVVVAFGNTNFGSDQFLSDHAAREYPTVWVAAALVLLGAVGTIVLTLREYVARRPFQVGIWFSTLAAGAVWLAIWYLIAS